MITGEKNLVLKYKSVASVQSTLQWMCHLIGPESIQLKLDVSVWFCRLIYLRVTGMDDGLNIKERVSYVNRQIQTSLLFVSFLL